MDEAVVGTDKEEEGDGTTAIGVEMRGTNQEMEAGTGKDDHSDLEAQAEEGGSVATDVKSGVCILLKTAQYQGQTYFPSHRTQEEKTPDTVIHTKSIRETTTGRNKLR